MAQEENTDMLELARSIAFEAHEGQQDKAGKNYILHPIRVAERLHTFGSEVQIVALLHDTIEDTFVTPEFLKEKGFSDEIVEAILSVTRKEGESYMEFIQRCAENPIGRIVKTEDLKDNMDITRLDKLTDEDVQRLRKYHKAYKYLVDYDKLKDSFWGFIETIDYEKEYEKWRLAMDIGKEIMGITFKGRMCNSHSPHVKFECEDFNITMSFDELPMVVQEKYVKFTQYVRKPHSEIDDEKLFELECDFFSGVDSFLKEYMGKQFVRTEYYTLQC